MTTIVNTPAPSSDNSDNGVGLVITLAFLLLIGVLFFVYGLPMIRRAAMPSTVQVPDKIDVNVNTPNNQ